MGRANSSLPTRRPMGRISRDIFALIALVVVLLNRRTMLNRGDGATEVLAAGLTTEGYEESRPDEQTPVRQLGIPDHDRARAIPSHAD
jgi:hypothetical protein